MTRMNKLLRNLLSKGFITQEQHERMSLEWEY